MNIILRQCLIKVKTFMKTCIHRIRCKREKIQKQSLKCTNCFINPQLFERQQSLRLVSMSKRQLWSKKQDETLIHLIQEEKITKWVHIASLLTSRYGLPMRTGKQCRDRYLNKLAKNLTQNQWLPHEDNLLIRMHGQYGRKWALIGQHLPGRGENSIKNRFYSKIRKTLRQLNKIVQCYLSSQFTPLHDDFLNKLISISAEKFKENSKWDEEPLDKAMDLIQQLFLGIDSETGEKNNLNRVRSILDGCEYFDGTKKILKAGNQSGSFIQNENNSTQVGFAFSLADQATIFQPQIFYVLQHFFV